MNEPQIYISPPGFKPPAAEISSDDSAISRRDFLNLAGFSLAAGAIWTGCARAPVQKAIPYLVPVEEMLPGRAVWTTAVCGGCEAGCGILVKNRDGRPIKIEGIPGHPINQGGICAMGQASLLGLYDERRLARPLVAGSPVSWDEFDARLIAQLKDIVNTGGAIRLLTGTIISPTTLEWIDKFQAAFPGSRHIVYDPLSASAIADANDSAFGVRAVPRYKFEKAEVVVTFDADFLGGWLSPVEYTAGYAPGRNPDRATPPSMSYHLQIESRLTITGAKADDRIALKPSAVIRSLTHIAAAVCRRADWSFNVHRGLDNPLSEAVTEKIADKLWSHRGRSLVIAGYNDFEVQSVVTLVNYLLGNYGGTVDIERPSMQYRGDDRALAGLMEELKRGEIAALIISGVNPVYDLPDGERFGGLMQRVPTTAVIAQRMNETTAMAQFVAAESHPLEAWSDAAPTSEMAAVSQPAVEPLGMTRTLAECLAAFAGAAASGYDLVRSHWGRTIYPQSNATEPFEDFWRRTLVRGWTEVNLPPLKVKTYQMPSINLSAFIQDSELELVVHASPTMHDGRHAYNPFLYELPDPVTKVTWDNVATLSPATAEKLGINAGARVKLEAGGRSLDLPSFVVEGQADGVVAVPLGYGGSESARFADIGPRWLFGRDSVGPNGLVGVNAAPLTVWKDGRRIYSRNLKSLTIVNSKSALACTQEHFNLLARDEVIPAGAHPARILFAASLEDYIHDGKVDVPPDRREGDDLWPEDHTTPVHRWGMVVDLNRCTGCSACIVACNIENNIPVVGRDEVRRNREMHWLRIDRYYQKRDANLRVSFMPMMCQQCANAPCETVCPVLATVHSEEGLNQQAYNRCVGTRYCANNCPYKTRRFNWFNYPYPHEGRERLILNPDVTVRSRGVMEKCTFCVQRIMAAKADAKAAGEALRDGAIQTACQQSCPAGAIVFGDLNDPESKVSRLMNNPRRYGVLAELNVRPSVGYLAEVHNSMLTHSITINDHSGGDAH